MIDSLLKGLETTKIKLISGDLPLGLWELEGTIFKQGATENSERIDLSTELKRVELKNQINKDPYEPFVGAGVGALVGLRLFGLIGAAGGAVAGHFLLSGRPEVSATIELKDGRTCIAVMSPAMLETLKSISK